METYTSKEQITVTRTAQLTTDQLQVGDKIEVGKYTATCQRIADSGAIFLLDQYLDKPYTHKDLLAKMNADLAGDPNFDGIRGRLANWLEDSGTEYPFRVPFAGEFFTGTEEDDWIKEYYEPDTEDGFKDVWPLMRDRKNRIALREGESYEWGWLMNRVKRTATAFAYVVNYGLASRGSASYSLGVRPAFCLI